MNRFYFHVLCYVAVSFLKQLFARGDPIVCDLESIDIFGTALVANQSLTLLDIRYNEIEEEGAKALQPHMPALPNAIASATPCYIMIE